MLIRRSSMLRRMPRPRQPTRRATRPTSCCFRMLTTCASRSSAFVMVLQSLNVWRTGSLVQHIESKVNHSAGAKVEVAHQGDCGWRIRCWQKKFFTERDAATVPVNSSHHQSADVVGDGLRAVAHCAEDGVIEAIEGTVPGHYVLAVQWHPERTFESDQVSSNLFQAFVDSAREWNERNSIAPADLAPMACCSVSYLPCREKELFCRWKAALPWSLEARAELARRL